MHSKWLFYINKESSVKLERSRRRNEESMQYTTGVIREGAKT